MINKLIAPSRGVLCSKIGNPPNKFGEFGGNERATLQRVLILDRLCRSTMLIQFVDNRNSLWPITVLYYRSSA